MDIRFIFVRVKEDMNEYMDVWIYHTPKSGFDLEFDFDFVSGFYSRVGMIYIHLS